MHKTQHLTKTETDKDRNKQSTQTKTIIEHKAPEKGKRKSKPTSDRQSPHHQDRNKLNQTKSLTKSAREDKKRKSTQTSDRQSAHQQTHKSTQAADRSTTKETPKKKKETKQCHNKKKRANLNFAEDKRGLSENQHKTKRNQDANRQDGNRQSTQTKTLMEPKAPEKGKRKSKQTSGKQ